MLLTFDMEKLWILKYDMTKTDSIQKSVTNNITNINV